MPKTLENHQYLGDAVYASSDGYHVWLHVGSHDNPPVVGLEPQVINALLTYYRKMGGQTDAN